MHGLIVIEGMTLSGHPWIINEIESMKPCFFLLFPLEIVVVEYMHEN